MTGAGEGMKKQLGVFRLNKAKHGKLATGNIPDEKQALHWTAYSQVARMKKCRDLSVLIESFGHD